MSTFKFLRTKHASYLRCLCTKNEIYRNNCIKSAGIIVIGNEVLKGLVTDTNSNFICKLMYKLGISVQQILVLADAVDCIATEVKKQSEIYDYVLTTGGIGPTHDDITYEAIAKAFGEKLVLNPILEKLLKEHSTRIKSSHNIDYFIKMAYVPNSAKITFGVDVKTGQRLAFPNVSVKNVYMFPGIPQLMEKSLLGLSHTLFCTNTVFYLKNIYLNCSEYEIVNYLNCVVQEFPNITIGSYPEILEGSKFKVKITMESTDECEVKTALDKFKSLLPQHVIEKSD